MKLNWNFLGGVGVQNKKPSLGGVWIFSGTTHSCKTAGYWNTISDAITQMSLFRVKQRK